MKKELTLAEMLNELEKEAKKIEAAGTFKGDYSAVAAVLAAGLKIAAK